MQLMISAAVERWPVAGEFIIARGAKQHVDVLLVAVRYDGHWGMGEGTAIYYHGDSAEDGLKLIESISAELSAMPPDAARAHIQKLMPPGAARNALDCALWELEAKQAAMPLWQYAGLKSAPVALQTAFTISLGDPAVMEADAAKAAARGFGILKLKLTGEGDRARVAAVRAGAPNARLIVDANGSWGDLDIAAEAQAMAELGVEMIEQPVAVGDDSLLAGITSPIPIIADESCQSSADIEICADYYHGINIKLDKAGGLTEALKMMAEADAQGLKVMLGCMLSTSLGIAPAFLAAQGADWVDLDAPALLAEDREDGFRFENGQILI